MGEKKLGWGIITCSVFNIIIYGFGTLVTGIGTFARPMVEKVLEEQGNTAGLGLMSHGEYIISFLIMSLTLLATIIILCKNKVGIFIYFLLIVINIIYELVTGKGISEIGIIIPMILAFFIYKKRSIFGFYDPKSSEYMNV